MPTAPARYKIGSYTAVYSVVEGTSRVSLVNSLSHSNISIFEAEVGCLIHELFFVRLS